MMDRLATLDKELRYFAGISLTDWGTPENNNRYTELCDDLVDLLTTPEGEPAANNIAFMRSQGWRINIVEKTEHGTEFWYGELFVWGPYNITFKWMGEDSVGV